MHANQIVARVLKSCLSELHAKRAAALRRAVVALLLVGALSVSSIGLAIAGAVALRHRIRSADRLLGNSGLQEARRTLYGRLAQWWLRGLPQVLLVGGRVGLDAGSALALAARQCGSERSQYHAL